MCYNKCSVKSEHGMAMADESAKAVRGSRSGRPVMVLLDLLGRRWTLRVMWELRDGPMTFRALQAACDEVSPTALNARLKDLRAARLVATGENGYALTDAGRDLGARLASLDAWATTWRAGLDNGAVE